nr:DNA helicase II [Candidatus Ishikawaella capsulata]
MRKVDLLMNLNNEQRKAVQSSSNHLLILAGAGSGKTRVLVHRIAWLLSEQKCSPCSIIAVTFTNKAAIEMRARIEQLMSINCDKDGMWIGTFHHIAHKLLRFHYVDAHLPKDFQIIDNEDQIRLIKRLIKALDLDEKKYTIRNILRYIKHKKDNGLRPDNIEISNNYAESNLLKIYKIYDDTCNRSGLVDFCELLLRAYELWLKKPHILKIYHERFNNIFIDEFQDTNRVQYSWIRLLAGKSSRILTVGDDDQSIYAWRGAEVTNMQRFLKDFSDSKTIRLEQNYRSTKNIIKVANALIKNNHDRLGKKLWTNSQDGNLISLYCALDEFDESRFVMNYIKSWQAKGNSLIDCAILYRSNAQSRLLEEVLLQNSISYTIYGGLRFFERQEIKDVLAYLRLILNNNDDTAFERVINTPSRGIGISTLNLIREIARSYQLTLWQAANKLLQENKLSTRAASSIKSFCELIKILEKKTINMPLHIQVDKVIKDSGLWCMYKEETGEKAEGRIENLKELVNATRQFGNINNNLILQDFLSQTMLEMTKEQGVSSRDAVQLMTIHASKGLEFKQVFMIGMEEGLFPSPASLNKSVKLEEERRLAYVGITRAKENLVLTYSIMRRIYGKIAYNLQSRFIKELPQECIKKIISYN